MGLTGVALRGQMPPPSSAPRTGDLNPARRRTAPCPITLEPIPEPLLASAGCGGAMLRRAPPVDSLRESPPGTPRRRPLRGARLLRRSAAAHCSPLPLPGASSLGLGPTERVMKQRLGAYIECLPQKPPFLFLDEL